MLCNSGGVFPLYALKVFTPDASEHSTPSHRMHQTDQQRAPKGYIMGSPWSDVLVEVSEVAPFWSISGPPFGTGLDGFVHHSQCPREQVFGVLCIYPLVRPYG